MKIVVMGSGSWGTTVAKVIADGGNEVMLWSRRKDLADEINETSRNGDYLPGVDLPKTLTATSNLQAALVNATQVYIAIPSQSLRETLGEWKELIPENATVISLMKGLEQSTGARMSEVIHQLQMCPHRK